MMVGLKSQRDAADEEVRLLEAAASGSARAITPARIARFAQVLKQAGTGTEFRKAYLRLFVRQVTVSDTEIRITGPTSALAHGTSNDALEASESVPSFIPAWRPVRGSNPCYQRERLVS